MIPTNLHFVSRPIFTPRLHHQFPLRRSSAMSAGAANPNPSPNPNPSIPPSTTKTVRVVIKGRVQGVFFRDWTVQNARKLGLNGWVRNRRDGSVEALFSGDPAAVDDMVGNRCPVGPTYAAVTGISSSPSDDDPGRGFSCQPTA